MSFARVVVVGLLAACLGLAVTGSTTAATVSASSSAPRPHAPAVFGVSLPGAAGDTAALDAFSTLVGRRPGLVMWYEAWSYRHDFPARAAAAVASYGAVPQITWEPWDPTQGVDQPDYALARIADGDYDDYLASWATEIAAYGGPVQLRFAHEMNGTWYPWGAGVNGNQPGDYVAAWRHIVGLFDRLGATNVQWIWSPNAPYPGSSVALAPLYPGDAVVDAVGLDGYNMGSARSWSHWTSFKQLFAAGVAQVQTFAHRPVYIAETGSTESGGSKAAWVRSMFHWLSHHREVAGFVWFERDKETDWRVESSTSSLRAFRAGLKTYGQRPGR